jgi:hypothetical protein
MHLSQFQYFRSEGQQEVNAMLIQDMKDQFSDLMMKTI